MILSWLRNRVGSTGAIGVTLQGLSFAALLALGYGTISRLAVGQHSVSIRADTIERAQEVAHLLLAAPEEEARSIVAAATDADATTTLQTPSPERQRFLETAIAPYTRLRRPGRLPYVIEGDNAHWRVNIPVRNGQWLSVESHPASAPEPEMPGVAAAFVVGVLGIAFASSLALRRLTQPLRQLERAALDFARDLDAQPLPEHGPTDIRRVTHAFNQMQEQLRRYVSDRTTMLAAISHDLRSPLQRLKFRADYMSDGEQREKMLRDLRDMETMIAATLDFARADADNEPTARHNLGLLLSDVADGLRECGYDVQLQGTPPHLSYPCRARALKRAVENLAVNAATYGGAVRLSLERDAGTVVITVDDDGAGMPEADLERVFAPFYRLEASRNAESGGTGLGLSIARSIVRGHGGDIVLMNRAGSGLRARLTLPDIL